MKNLKLCMVSSRWKAGWQLDVESVLIKELGNFKAGAGGRIMLPFMIGT